MLLVSFQGSQKPDFCIWLVSLFNDISTFMDYVILKPCTRAVFILFNL